MGVRQCVTVGESRERSGSKKYPYHQPLVYAEHFNRTTRVLVWKFVSTAGDAVRDAALAEQAARDVAARRGCPFIPGVRRGTRVEAKNVI
jgi:hypothetical protein